MQEEVKYELINMDSTAAIARWLPQQLFSHKYFTRSLSSTRLFEGHLHQIFGSSSSTVSIMT